MTPDEHAAEAERLLAVGLPEGKRAPVISERDAIRALTHALLALRPAQPEAVTITLPGSGLDVGDGRDVPAPALMGGVWVTHYHDGSSFAVHRSELDARRAAARYPVGDQVPFMPFGASVHDIEAPS